MNDDKNFYLNEAVKATYISLEESVKKKKMEQIVKLNEYKTNEYWPILEDLWPIIYSEIINAARKCKSSLVFDISSHYYELIKHNMTFIEKVKLTFNGYPEILYETTRMFIEDKGFECSILCNAVDCDVLGGVQISWKAETKLVWDKVYFREPIEKYLN